jgi:monoamine oxidase
MEDLSYSKDTMKDQEIVQQLLTQLDTVFCGGQAKARGVLVDAIVSTFNHDKHIQGSYSGPTVHEGDARVDLRDSVNNTIFFAGEATHQVTGMIHTSMETGQRAARQVLDSLNLLEA